MQYNASVLKTFDEGRERGGGGVQFNAASSRPLTRCVYV
jgi:hypothetical protein